jgi:hypothetical protein
VSDLTPLEDWARRCIRIALGVEVEQHDDGSSPGMHDLSILYPSGAWGAVEVTAAADPQLIGLWRLVNEGERWIVPGIAGGWAVVLHPSARAKRLGVELPALLRKLESEGIRQIHPEKWWEPGPWDDAARRLGILRLFQSNTDYPGSVYPTVDPGPERSGGAVLTDGGPLLEWLADWLVRPDQQHNVSKLARSGGDERHLFVILPGFAEAPFAVEDLLMRDNAPLPSTAPAMPTEITHVWVAST